MALSDEYPNIEVFGEPDDSRNCYIETRVHGLFACLYCILYGFYICYKENLNGVVRMGKEHLYYDKNFGENVFEYFFDQPQILHAPMTVKVINPGPLLRWCNISTVEKQRANFMIGKFLHLKPEIALIIENYKRKNFSVGNILGVHYRGRDKRNETQLLPFEYYIDKIDEIFSRNLCDRIFFCTDELSLREIVKARYKNKVITYELEAIPDASLSPQQGLHINSIAPYFQGKDALIETLLLSTCNILLSSSSSSMSIFATYLNPSILHLPLER